MTPVCKIFRPIVLLGPGVCLTIGGEALCVLGALEHAAAVQTAAGPALYWLKR